MQAERAPAASLSSRLRPVSGIEQELVAADRGGNAAELCNELLARCLARPGHDPAAARGEVARLLVTDRDFALVELRRHSFGSQLQMELGCPLCGAGHDIVIDLDRLSAPLEVPAVVENCARLDIYRGL